MKTSVQTRVRCATAAFAAAGVMLAAIPRLADAAEETRPPVFQAHDFVDSVGFNTHILHADSFYALQFDLMKERLLSARIRHIRDGALDQRGNFFANDGAARFKELGSAGIGVTFVFRMPVTAEFVRGFPARMSPAFEAYELPNELNVQSNWAARLQEWLPVFRQYVKGDPASARYPIIGPSIADMGNNPYRQLGNQGAQVDFGNIHKYYRNFPPSTSGYGGPGSDACSTFRYGSLAYASCNSSFVAGGKPLICTEAGYGSNPAAGRQVTPEVQAKYIARMLMLHLKGGVRRTFLYQLADYGTDAGAFMGLLTSTGGEKPAFRELRALMTELDDPASAGTPSRPAIAIRGEIADVESMLFTKSDGSLRLVIWIEKPSYDTKAAGGVGEPLAVPAQKVTVDVPSQYLVRKVMVFGDGDTANVTASVNSAGRLDLSLSDNLTIVDMPRNSSKKAPAPPEISRVGIN